MGVVIHVTSRVDEDKGRRGKCVSVVLLFLLLSRKTIRTYVIPRRVLGHFWERSSTRDPCTRLSYLSLDEYSLTSLSTSPGYLLKARPRNSFVLGTHFLRP